MQGHVTKMIWCEYCRREGWDQVSTWRWDGKAVTRSGVLKVPTGCGSCGDWILAGERVEAIALNLDQSEMTEWMAEYIETEEELEEEVIEEEA
jgi:hypothetical protein